GTRTRSPNYRPVRCCWRPHRAATTRRSGSARPPGVCSSTSSRTWRWCAAGRRPAARCWSGSASTPTRWWPPPNGCSTTSPRCGSRSPPGSPRSPRGSWHRPARTCRCWDGDVAAQAAPGAGPRGRRTALARYEAGATAADPHLASHQLERLEEAAARAGGVDELRAARDDGGGPWRRLVAVLGASMALGDHLVAHPTQWRVLSGPPPAAAHEGVTDPAGLRLSYRGALLRIAADDLTGEIDLEQVMARLSALADATLAAAFRIAAAEVAAGQDPGHGGGLAVVAMGKCGGNELNYVSDVDVIFVAADGAALEEATAVARRLMEICAQAAWPVDAGLRPEGHHGPLVRTLASHLAYYRKWAHTWEFQALLKARPVAGDLALAADWLARLQPLIWSATQRPDAVEDIR